MVIRLSERVCCDPDDPRDCAERASCEEVGESGHTFCGVCPEHLIPRHRCGCSASPSTKPQYKAARWMNTGGDMLIHLVPVDTVTDGYPHANQETSPKCGLGIYHGGWHSITEVKVPLRLCDRCFPGGRL